jgi:hypothetical protein
MTQTNDPPLISSLELIPDANEKADLDAPSGSGGKLVIGQAPNITITETTVVADAAERLALDVQEGDIAIQTNVSSSFIFTGGDNVAPNWQVVDFDAVGAIDSEDINPRDITPRNITASGNISLQDLTVAGAFNGADTSAAAAGEALTSDGSGSFAFASVGGDLNSLITASPVAIGGFVDSSASMQEVISSPTAFDTVINSQPAMQEVAASQTAMQEVAASQTAMQEVAASQTAMQEVATSPTAMQEVGLSATAQSEIINSNSAVQVLNNNLASESQNINNGLTNISDLNNAANVYLESITVIESGGSCDARIEGDGLQNQTSNTNINLTVENFVNNVLAGACINFGGDAGGTASYQYIPI